MRQRDANLNEVIVYNADIEAEHLGYRPVTLSTNRGELQGRYYPVENASQGAIWVGGVGGDWDTPADGLYPKLAHDLKSNTIASLRLYFRYPTQLQEAVHDVLAGVSFLQDQEIDTIALIGHSFGGAVVIQAGVRSPCVRTVVALASQAYGAESVAELATRSSLLLLHGRSDRILPYSCSQNIYQLALEPKKIILYPDADHGLDKVAAEVYSEVREWIINQLTLATV
ncbi:MAG: alpha/beta hydrolase family protein [Halothece sp.]